MPKKQVKLLVNFHSTKSTRILHIVNCVWSRHIGKIGVNDKTSMKNLIKQEKKIVLHKFLSKEWFRSRFCRLDLQKRVLTSITLFDSYRTLAGREQ